MGHVHEKYTTTARFNVSAAGRRQAARERRWLSNPYAPATAESRAEWETLTGKAPTVHRPQRARAAHRTGRVPRSTTPVTTSAASSTPASDGGTADGDGDPEPASVARLPPSPAAFALADAFAALLAQLLSAGALTPTHRASPPTDSSSLSRSFAARPENVYPRPAQKD